MHLPRCGDNMIDTGEACDDGDANADDVVDACRTQCVRASCGDNMIDTGEECDGGPDCNDDCTESLGDHLKRITVEGNPYLVTLANSNSGLVQVLVIVVVEPVMRTTSMASSVMVPQTKAIITDWFVST